MSIVTPVASRKPRLPKPPPSRLREFVTPEGVDLRLRIGEASERAAAYTLDLIFINGSLFVLFLAAIGAANAFHQRTASEIAYVIWQLASFVISNAYFIVFELGPRAAA